MGRKPEDYARKQIVASVNHWPHEWMDISGKELYAISPVSNVFAALQGVRQLLTQKNEYSALEAFNQRYGTAHAPAISDRAEGNLIQESGKPDLMVCLLDKDGRTISVSIEAKAFVKKFALDDSLWRDNQKDWMHKTTFGYGYWIFLWGIPEEIPHTGLRSKAVKESVCAWLIPGLIWERKAQLYYQNTKQYTIHMSLEGLRVKKALKDAGLTVNDLFAPYEMFMNRDVWWPGTDHPLRIMLNTGVALGPACTMAGDDDAKYVYPPKSFKTESNSLDETADRENGGEVSKKDK